MDKTQVPSAQEPIAPLLRWAGGKRWLVKFVRELIRDAPVEKYHEPFLGGGSIFFGLPFEVSANLSDANADLIEMYEQVRINTDEVAQRLSEHTNDSDHYYSVRSARASSSDPVQRAADFIFLNHTSFNGIYRVNLRGEYNVPFGRRVNPTLPSASDLRVAAARLESATLRCEDFEEAIDRVGDGDLVFLDPPYTVSHNDNGFVKYNQKLFSFDDQVRLGRAIDVIRARKARYILTNAAHESIAELFERGDRRFEMTRRNSIGGLKAGRGSAAEYLFTNVGTNDAN